MGPSTQSDVLLGRIVHPIADERHKREDNSGPVGVGASGMTAGLAAAGLFALALVPLGQVVIALGVVGSVVALVVAVVGIVTGERGAVRLSVLTLMLVLTGVIGLPFGIWFAVAAVWLASRAFPHLAPVKGWLPEGRFSPSMWWLTGATVILAGAGLTIWALLASDRAPATTLELVEAGRDLSAWAIALFVVIFVPVNAVTEEIAYRGTAFESASAFLPKVPAVVAQAVAFGTLHVAGFPAGIAGVLLTFGYGLLMGIMRHVSGGLRYSVIAHMAADATIAILVIVLLLPT